MSAIQEVLAQVRINEVYTALTGVKPRRTGQGTWRGPATWRGGGGLNVSMDDRRGVWHDFVTGDGGGVLDLVQQVHGGSRAGALRLVAELAGVTLDDVASPRVCTRDYAAEAQIRSDAHYFAFAAQAMAEWELEELSPTDPARRVPTELLQALRISPEAAYRECLRNQPERAAALVQAGRRSVERTRIRLAHRLMDLWNATN